MQCKQIKKIDADKYWEDEDRYWEMIDRAYCDDLTEDDYDEMDRLASLIIKDGNPSNNYR